ncbi:MAG: type II toxin-antitoxin system VapC family toxin [Oscillospiraceae bacterium]|nr:type II toxin-antitoxin system VapC family toxin [Oscillospiraceae bacterium]
MKNHSQVVARYEQNKPLGIAISSITLSELKFGVYNSKYPEQNGENLFRFLLGVELLDYDSAAADEYGKIRAYLRRKGTPVGEMDMLIAAHSKAKGLITVTNNTREFERIDGLYLEDWSL